MKILHFADLHLDQVTRENAPHAIELIVDIAQRERPDLIVNAGDLAWKRGHIAPWVSLALRDFHVRLGAVAPVLVVAGNHDHGAAMDVGTVMGTLAQSASPNVMLVEEPQVLQPLMGLPRIICLPYPSRARFLARNPGVKADEINERMSQELIQTVNDMSWGDPSLLVYHGSIAGAKSDSEQVMSTEIDLVLDESRVPSCVTAILCGHIHRAQRIGRAVYPGSPYPITFAEERFAHGVVVWDDLSPRFVPIEPRFPLVTIDKRRDDFIRPVVAADALIENNINPDLVIGARVRLLATEDPAFPHLRDMWCGILLEGGAVDVRVQIEPRGRERRPVAEIHAEASIGEQIDLYGATRADLNGLLPRVRTLALALEERLPADVRMRQKAAGYCLTRLAWDNWKSYGADNELALDACGSTVSVEGDNAAGKSNLAEIECFALYGRTPRGRVPLGDLVRNGEREAAVTAEFAAAGKSWRITRRLKVNAKGVGAADLEMTCEDDPAALGTARETQALIESLVGPFDLYLATRFASQGEIDRLLDLTPGELAATLQSALATEVFEHREKVGREELASATREEETHEASLGAWREEAARKEEREEAAREAASAMDRARERAKRVAGEVGEAERAARALQTKLDGVTAAQKQWDELKDEEESALGELADLKHERDTQHAITERAEKAVGEVAELLPARDELARMEQAQALRDERQAALHSALAHLATVEKSYGMHLQARAERLTEFNRLIDRQEAAFRAERDNWARTKKLAEEKLGDLRTRAGLIEQTPFGEKCVTASCALIADAAEALRKIPSAAQWIEDHEQNHLATLARLEGELAVTHEQRDYLASQPDMRAQELETEAHEATVRVQKADAALAESEVDEVALVRTRHAVRQLEAAEKVVAGGEAARETLRALERPLRDAEKRHAALSERMRTAGDRPNGLAIAHELQAAEAALEEARGTLAVAEMAADAAAQDLGHARAEVGRSAEAAERLAAAAEESERLRSNRAAAQVYVEAMGRLGLPFLMLSRALPALESYANHFLCGDLSSGLTVEVGDCKRTQAGDERNEIELRYSNAFGSHPISAASGFERTAIGYALRAALAQVQADAAGVEIGHWIADEGWGVFDETNLVNVAQPMIRRLSERFGRVILISHQAAIREVCETRLTVTADPVTGSRITGTPATKELATVA